MCNRSPTCDAWAFDCAGDSVVPVAWWNTVMAQAPVSYWPVIRLSDPWVVMRPTRRCRSTELYQLKIQVGQPLQLPLAELVASSRGNKA